MFLGCNGRDTSINISSKSSKTPWKQRKWNECNHGKLTSNYELILSDLHFCITGNNGEWNQSRFGSNAYKTVKFWNGKFQKLIFNNVLYYLFLDIGRIKDRNQIRLGAYSC